MSGTFYSDLVAIFAIIFMVAGSLFIVAIVIIGIIDLWDLIRRQP